jgi:hypothetical protein
MSDSPLSDIATLWANETVIKWAKRWLVDEWGKAYVFGSEVAPNTTADTWDCSELVERLFNDVVHLPLPDGSYNQYGYCRRNGRQIQYPTEVVQPLDLIFLWDTEKKQIDHVAIVFDVLPGAGPMLIEARGRPWNHVMFSPLDKFLKQFDTRSAGIWRIEK